MNILRIIVGLIIGWFILVLISIVGIIQLLTGFIRGLVYNVTNANGASASGNRAEKSVHAGALDLSPCPHCGVYTSGLCGNPDCQK